MQTHTVHTYSFNELSDSAKESARDWYRQGALDYDWWDSVYEDASRVYLEITSFDLGRAQSISGKLERGVHDTVQAIITQHGKDCDTYKLAQTYYTRKHDGYPMDVEEFTQQLLEEYHVMLEREYEWLMSDECVDENIEINEYQFTESGDIWG